MSIGTTTRRMAALHRSRREHVDRPDRDASGATEGAHGGAPLSPRQSQDDPRVLETHKLRLDGPLHSDMDRSGMALRAARKLCLPRGNQRLKEDEETIFLHGRRCAVNALENHEEFLDQKSLLLETWNQEVQMAATGTERQLCSFIVWSPAACWWAPSETMESSILYGIEQPTRRWQPCLRSNWSAALSGNHAGSAKSTTNVCAPFLHPRTPEGSLSVPQGSVNSKSQRARKLWQLRSMSSLTER